MTKTMRWWARGRSRTSTEWLVTWPVCTAHPECDHERTHESVFAADDYACEHTAEMVNGGGYAICTCHPIAEADALGVTPFACDEGRA